MKVRPIYKISAGVLLPLALLAIIGLRVDTTGSYERIFNASPAKLWLVWNDPASIEKWWGPKGYTAPVIRNDPRVGATYLWSMKSPTGEMSWTTGVYKEVRPNTTIVSTMSFSDATGKAIPGAQVPIPGHWPDAILVTVEFIEVGGKTKVRVTETGVPLLIAIVSRFAWDQQFDKIDALL